MTPRRARFAPKVPCAVEPRAFGLYFDLPPPPVVETRGDIAIVSIRGPLVHHDDPCFDSYDAIKARVLSCLGRGVDEKVRAIVLSIDSPGGVVSGCFDTADEIAARCAEAGVALYSYVDGQATSAAYALACAGSRIAIPPTGMVGSIGCVAELVDVSAMNAAMGVQVSIVTSGKRKADGNPNLPTDDASVAAVRAQVMQLAGLFFEHVASTRPAQVDELRTLEAGIVIGAEALPMLADDVMGLDEMIAAIAAGSYGQQTEIDMTTKTGAQVQGSKASDDADYEAAISTLRKAAAAGNTKAKKMLQAEVADDEPDGDEGKKAAAGAETPAEPPKKDEPAAAAPPAKEPDGDEKDAKATASAALAEAKTARRETMLAARPDLSPELRATLETLEPDQVKAILAATPAKPAPKLGTAAASSVVSATRGEGQTGAPASATSPTLRQQIDDAMGVRSKPVQPELRADGRQTFPALTRAEGADWIAKREAEAKAAREALAGK